MPPSNGRQCATARRATSSCWQRPDLCLEHLQHIREEVDSVVHLCRVIIIGEEASSVEHLIISLSLVRRLTIVDLIHEDNEEGHSTSTERRTRGGPTQSCGCSSHHHHGSEVMVDLTVVAAALKTKQP
jgi:hypothetical protein